MEIYAIIAFARQLGKREGNLSESNSVQRLPKTIFVPLAKAAA
jgi:hypothetical protein